MKPQLPLILLGWKEASQFNFRTPSGGLDLLPSPLIYLGFMTQQPMGLICVDFDGLDQCLWASPPALQSNGKAVYHAELYSFLDNYCILETNP